MCILFVALNKHPNYPVVVIGNRDEYFVRPTQPAQYDTEYPQLLAGRDLQKGGTWFGVTNSGRFAAITNFRTVKEVSPKTTSRGHLALNFLKGSTAPLAFLAGIINTAGDYEGFNVILGDHCSFAYYSNINNQAPVELEPGKVYGLSNSFLDTPWPKLQHGKTLLTNYLNEANDHNIELDVGRLFEILQDKTKPPANELPDTGIGEPWETLLSSIFVVTPFGYGTRSSSVYLLDSNQHATFIEQSYHENGATATTKKFEFDIST